MNALAALTAWLCLLFSALNLVFSLRWILALAVAWVATLFLSMALLWTGATTDPLKDAD